MEAVDLPDAAADTVAHHGMTQLFADGDAHPVHAGAVASGVEHQKPVRLPGGAVKPLKNVIPLQSA